MTRTKEQRNSARRAKYAENKKRLDACNKFSLEMMRRADEEGYTARLQDYFRRCILEDKPAKISDYPFGQ